MSVSLTTHRGKPAIELPDHKGELWLYLWSVLPGTLWRCSLAKVDPETGEAGSPYVVTAGTPWVCTCSDFHYRRKRTTAEDCKHTAAARELRALLESLQGVAS